MISANSIRRTSANHSPLLPILFLCPLLALIASGCAEQEAGNRHEAGPPEETAPKIIRLWAQTGQSEERVALRNLIHDFNTTRDDPQLDLHFIPSDAYHEHTLRAAEAGQLPDILAIDAPHFYKFASEGFLRPLDDLLPEKIRHDLLPSVIEQGSYNGSLYAVATCDTGLGLFIDTRAFEGVARIPRGLFDSWTIDEFEEILALLQEQNNGGPVLDLKMNYGWDWPAFALAPILRSAGGDLVCRETGLRASGIVNAPETVAAMKRVQKWFDQGYIDPNEDDAAFTDGRVPISLTGHWDFERYFQATDGHLRLVPLPDFGNGSRTNQGGWAWAISAHAEHPSVAMEFLSALLETDYILSVSDVTGGVPARYEAIERSSHFGSNAELHLYVQQLESAAAAPRPRTKAYPEISLAFVDSFQNITEGADVQSTLDSLAETIESLLAGRSTDGADF